MLANGRLKDIVSRGAAADAAARERRREQRHMAILRVGTLVAGDRRELCLIRNISARGLMATVYSRREPGERVAIELKTNQQVCGLVVWVRDANIGVQFDEEVEVAEVLSNPPFLDNGWRPRLPRVEIDRLATVRAGARTYWVGACDISLGGVKIQADQPLEVDGEVVVTLEGFRPIAGVVRWQSDGKAGIAFNQIVPFQELKDWLGRDG